MSYEDRILKKTEVLIQAIIDYCILIKRITFSPQKTLQFLLNNPSFYVVTPVFFFVLNVIFSSAVSSFIKTEKIKDTLSAITIKTPITLDTLFFEPLLFFAGFIIFILILQLVSRRLVKWQWQYQKLFRSFFYASGLLVPLTFLDSFIYSPIEHWLFEKPLLNPDQSMSQDDLVSTFIFALIRYFGPLLFVKMLFYMVSLILWTRVFCIGLQLQTVIKPKIIIKIVTYSIIIFITAQQLICVSPSFPKAFAIYEASSAKKEIDAALNQSPPNYFKASFYCFQVSSNIGLPPYIRYMAIIRGVVYQLGHTDDKQAIFVAAMEKIKMKDYVWLEQTLKNTIESQLRESSEESPENTYHLTNLLKSLNSLEKLKTSSDFIRGDNRVYAWVKTTDLIIKIVP